jgi:large subunit ribosomal protein L23
MSSAWVIIKPVLTEKTLKLQSQGVWTFFVHKKATKNQINNAVKELFAVNPIKVRIIRVKPKTKMIWKHRRKVVLSEKKKALVSLKSGEKIKQLVYKESK